MKNKNNLIMQDLKLFLEGRTIDEVTVKDIKTNKKVDVAYYCYDKESLNKVSYQYEHVGKYWIDKGFFIAILKNKSTWVVNTNKEFEMHTWQPNGEYLKYNNKEKYTYKELLELLEQGETMLIVVNK